MSDLPVQVMEAGLLFQRAGIERDADAFKMIIDFGHAQIDATHPEDPIRAPLNVLRRQMARWEWDRVIRTAGRDLRGTIANSLVRQLEFEITRRETDILARDTEARRQDAVTFDARQRIQEFDLMSQINLRDEKKRQRFGHDLNEEAEDASSRRRKDERINETAQQISLLLSQALLNASNVSSAQEILNLVTDITCRISEVRNDNTIEDDDKHLFIKTLLDSLPLMLRKAQDHGA